jgi:hypothetical protein
MTNKSVMTTYLPAVLCFVSLSACCLDDEPQWDLGNTTESSCHDLDACLNPGDPCFAGCPLGSSCNASINFCEPDFPFGQPKRPDAGWFTPNTDASVPQRSPDAGLSPDVGAQSAGGSGGASGSVNTGGAGGSSAPPCSGCEAPGTNAPAPVIAPLCQFNHQCGRDGRCLDGSCQAACTSSATCGTGDVCLNGFCQVNPNGGGACVFGSQCAGGTCINGTCHQKCATTCANAADICYQGVCKPNRNPSPQCKRSADCGGSGMCVNGACRTACFDDRGCGAGTSGTICMMGYCVASQELTPQCEINSQCGNGTMCVNAVCCTPK